GGMAVARNLRAGGRERQVLQLAPGTDGCDSPIAAPGLRGIETTGRRARSVRRGAAGAETVGRGRNGPPRVPGPSREGRAGHLDDLRDQVAARRGAVGPEQVHRGRAATRARLRGNETAREDDPAA